MKEHKAVSILYPDKKHFLRATNSFQLLPINCFKYPI